MTELDRQTPSLDAAIRASEAERHALAAQLGPRRAALDLRFWRQSAHLTTPASQPAVARKAVEGRTGAVGRALKRHGLTAAALAEALDLATDDVARQLEVGFRPPVVVLDGEDGIAPDVDTAARATSAAADVLARADWGPNGMETLRFYRPPGLAVEGSIRDLYTLLWTLRQAGTEAFPLDGIVMPKVEHPEEVDLVNDMLERAEADLDLPIGSVRVAYLIESGSALAHLPEIALRAAPRLASLIFGLADYSADLGLPSIERDHPLALWARSEIIAVAGAVGVPAIDAMTLDFPVAEPHLDATANRQRWLDRMRLVYDDARHARDLGMHGKWVGHPAQLFAVMLAFQGGMTDDALEREAAKVEAYNAAVADGTGVTMIAGVMSDRATDRHARALLHRATAQGRFDPDRAHALGVIGNGDVAAARLAFAASEGRSLG